MSDVQTSKLPKRAITIHRPDGVIPGLLEVNSMLAECFGVTVVAVIEAGSEWVGTELRRAKIDGDEIIVGEPIKSADEIKQPKDDTMKKIKGKFIGDLSSMTIQHIGMRGGRTPVLALGPMWRSNEFLTYLVEKLNEVSSGLPPTTQNKEMESPEHDA